MNTNQKYLKLWSFFIIYFSDPVDDSVDDAELVSEMVKEISPDSLSFIYKGASL